MEKLVSEISQATLNILFPIHCANCNTKLTFNNKDYLCDTCIKSIRFYAPPFCIRCGRSIDSFDKNIEPICADCIGKNYFFKQSWQCCEYSGIIKELIHKLKYNRRLYTKHLFSNILLDYFNRHIGRQNIDIILAVPMHKDSIDRRGFNQAQLLTEALSEKTEVPSLRNTLLKIKKTKDQIGLNRYQRMKNLKDAFTIKNKQPIEKKRVLLIDDVFTTGTTMDECAKVLSLSGAESIYTLSLARSKI